MHPQATAAIVVAMHRPTALALLAVLALPAAAQAAPAKLSPTASAVSPAGVTTVEAANPNPYALTGRATMTAGGRTVASRRVRLPKRSVTTVTLRLSSKARQALRSAGGRATIMLRVRRRGGRLTIARRTLTLQLPASTPSPAPAPAAEAPAASGQPGGAPAPQPAAPASNRWVGRMGSEGPYDKFELTLDNGQLQLAKPPLVPVFCFAGGAGSGTATSLELFDAPGPWTVGTDGQVDKQGVAVNQLVGSSARTITYKVTGTSQEPGRIAGTLGMTFYDSKLSYDLNLIHVNCSGSQSFEAVPAP
jgi:hypothetical protein